MNTSENSIAKPAISISPELREAIEILKKPESFKKGNRQVAMANMAKGIALVEALEIAADDDTVFAGIIETRNAVWKVYLRELSDAKRVKAAGDELYNHIAMLVRTLSSFQQPTNLDEAVSILWRYTQRDLPNSRSVDMDGSKAALVRLGRGMMKLVTEGGSFTEEEWMSWHGMIRLCCEMDLSEWKAFRDMQNSRVKNESAHDKPSALETSMRIIIDEWAKNSPRLTLS